MKVAGDATRIENAPATFNRMVSQMLRPLRDFALRYFDDIFVHSRAKSNFSDAHFSTQTGVKSCETTSFMRIAKIVCVLCTENSGAGFIRE